MVESNLEKTTVKLNNNLTPRKTPWILRAIYSVGRGIAYLLVGDSAQYFYDTFERIKKTEGEDKARIWAEIYHKSF
jgi:hypothetical protein